VSKRKKNDRRAERKTEKARRDQFGATIAQYGPDDRTVTKVVVGIAPIRGGKPINLKRWVGSGITDSPDFRKELIDFIRENGARRIVFTTGVIGCIHEEGEDYPEGAECPFCSFWRGRDRWANARPMLMTLSRLRDQPPW
jgi:hypothetical protein